MRVRQCSAVHVCVCLTDVTLAPPPDLQCHVLCLHSSLGCGQGQMCDDHITFLVYYSNWYVAAGKMLHIYSIVGSSEGEDRNKGDTIS